VRRELRPEDVLGETEQLVGECPVGVLPRFRIVPRTQLWTESGRSDVEYLDAGIERGEPVDF
jgi:hypothetical protein